MAGRLLKGGEEMKEMRLWAEAFADFAEGALPALLVAASAILPWVFLCLEVR